MQHARPQAVSQRFSTFAGLRNQKIPVKPHGATSSSVAAFGKPADSLVFQLELFMTEYTPNAEMPFGIVFVVPNESKQGNLKIKDVQLPVNW
jgi:hypothetical protein